MTRTATAAAIAPLPAPTAQHQLLPLAQLRESPHNHRRTWGDLDELAESVRRQGVLQPVLARPVADGHELVFGHRRFRAAKAAGLEVIPAMVRQMTDLEVLEAQVVENLQRQDVHPLEEAEGYEQLLAQKERPYTVDDIAAKVGKSRAYVYGRMKLLALCPAARKAFYDGILTASTALYVARIPVADLQVKAIAEIERFSDVDDPCSARQAQDIIHQHFMLGLAEAKFPKDDPELVAGAGPCTTCPKRTGNQRELFPDVKSADVCTDPVCFRAKTDAVWQRRVAEAQAGGRQVLSEKEAKASFSYGSLRHDADFVDLAQSNYQDPKTRTWKQLLGKGAKDVAVLARDDRGEVHELVPKKDAYKLLKAAGHDFKKERSSSDYTGVSKEDRKKAAEQHAIDQEVERRIQTAFGAALDKKEPNREVWNAAIGVALDQCFDEADEILVRRGHLDSGLDSAEIHRRFEKVQSVMKLEQLQATLLEVLLFTDVAAFNSPKVAPLLKWAGIDPKAIAAEVKAERKAPPKSPPAKSGSALTWTTEKDGRVLGVAGDGLVYSVAMDGDRWCWKQGKKRGRGFVKLSDAKADAERADLERQADQRLKNAGAGELTKADVKGEAVKRRGGRR